MEKKTLAPLRTDLFPLIKWAKRLVISLTLALWIGLAFWMTSLIIQPLLMVVIASLLAYALYPLVKLIQRFLPRGLAIPTAFLSVALLLIFVLYLLVRVAIEQVNTLFHFVQNLLASPQQNPLAFLNDWLQNLGITSEQLRTFILQLAQQLQGLLRNTLPFLTGAFSGLLNVLLVAALCVYILFTGPSIANWLRYKTPLSQRTHVVFLLDVFKNIAGGYIRSQLLLSTILSAITGTVMGLIGVPFSLFLGVLSFILSFIPTIGAFTTGIICVLLALTQGWVTTALAVAFLLGLQVLETQILSPRIVGSAVGLHPLVALLALIIGAKLLGTVGALFAAPLAGILQALVLSVWTTWRTNHPEQFSHEDDTLLASANALEEKGLAYDPPQSEI